MSLNLSITTAVQESTGVQYFNVNAPDDFVQLCKITDIVIENDYFQVVGKVKSGEVISTSRQYYPDEKRATSPEKYQKAINIRLALIANILRRFYGEDYVLEVPEGTGWTEMLKMVKEKCEPHFDKTLLWVKLVIEKSPKGYFTNISSFAPFENYVADKAPKLKTTAQDINALKERNEAVQATPDSDTSNTTSAKADDDPF